MKTRAITGFFFVIVMLASMLFGHYPFGIFFLILTALCLNEFYGLVKQSGAGMAAAGFIYVIFAFITYHDTPLLHSLIFLIPVFIIGIFVQEIYKKSDTPFVNIGFTLTGLAVVCVPFTFFHALAYVQGSFNFHFPLAFMLLLWANDTGAYLVGRAFGRTKLFERHSPKKTWEGFFGGIVIAAGASLIISYYWPELPWNRWVALAILISCFGTLGDLVESMFKRSINVKDSGGLLPGHGGLLDRFDGLFLAAPVVYAYLYFMLNN
jgi:phosphatidate cytidylyltransferase